MCYNIKLKHSRDKSVVNQVFPQFFAKYTGNFIFKDTTIMFSLICRQITLIHRGLHSELNNKIV